ncbi:hypothetical protein LCGC14_2410140 [marine sediment metagenome]|uniref:Uncharacterized protein n=1 Tax=marine sediment metagenome TaxID=412755 RepID=A0A0F9BSL8_9ZZZZ
MFIYFYFFGYYCIMVDRGKGVVRRVGEDRVRESGLPVVRPRVKGDWLVEICCVECGLLVGFGPRCYAGRGFVCDFCESLLVKKNYPGVPGEMRGDMK